jgi:hypothetical protein
MQHKKGLFSEINDIPDMFVKCKYSLIYKIAASIEDYW